MSYDIIEQKFINGIYSSVLSSEAGSPPITSLYFVYGVCGASSCMR
jgi:hypothetical protein